MKHLFDNFEDNIDIFNIKRVSIANDIFENSKKDLIRRNIETFLNPKNNYQFRYVCVEKYYSEIADERAAIGMMDSDIMKIRMKNMVMKHHEV